MVDTVDARGLSCPQPVLLVTSKMKELKGGRIEVMVDSDCSRENVTRAATHEGWQVIEVKEDGGDYNLVLESR